MSQVLTTFLLLLLEGMLMSRTDSIHCSHISPAALHKDLYIFKIWYFWTSLKKAIRFLCQTWDVIVHLLNYKLEWFLEVIMYSFLGGLGKGSGIVSQIKTMHFCNVTFFKCKQWIHTRDSDKVTLFKIMHFRFLIVEYWAAPS